MIERVHNVSKPGRKRQLEIGDTPAPSSKRGRPKKDTLLERYPSLSPSTLSSTSVEESQKSLNKELEKETPRKDLVLPLTKSTFHFRRPLVVQAAAKNVSIQNVLADHKCLRLSYVVNSMLYCSMFLSCMFLSCMILLTGIDTKLN